MSFLRASVRSRPYLPPPGPRLRGEVQGAGGGNAGRRKRRAGRKGPSPERSPLQLQPRAPSLFPAPQTRRWRRQRRKEAPVLQRHLALQHRLLRAEGDSGGAAAPEPSGRVESPAPAQTPARTESRKWIRSTPPRLIIIIFSSPLPLKREKFISWCGRFRCESVG
uniref:Uncharacterized protein n=1 Tax=Rhinopithecus bieti TaxID=61621 RepID=A0A2K6JRK3_RHIBE